MWAYFSLNQEEHLKHLHDRFSKDVKEINWRTEDFEFDIERGTFSKETLFYVDRINFCLKYFYENVDIDLPNLFYSSYDGETISFLNSEYKHERLSDLMDTYLSRIENLLQSAKSLTSQSNSNSTITSKWQNLIVNNKLEELLFEMIEYYQNIGDIDNLKQAIILNQRFNSNKDEKNKGIKSQEHFDLELRQITNSIIDVIYSKK